MLKLDTQRPYWPPFSILLACCVFIRGPRHNSTAILDEINQRKESLADSVFCRCFKWRICLRVPAIRPTGTVCVYLVSLTPKGQNMRRILSKMTLFAVHSAVACVTHSRAWMPASSQMAGLSPPVLNCKTSIAQHSNRNSFSPVGGRLSPRVSLCPLSVLGRIKRTRGDGQVTPACFCCQFAWSLSFKRKLKGRLTSKANFSSLDVCEKKLP